MKKHKMPDMKEGGVNVTPLIDIIMCLIIFFMLVAKIGVTRGVDQDIRLPDSIIGTKIANLSDSLTINVHFVPGSSKPVQFTTLVNNDKKEIMEKELDSFLKAFKAAHGDKSKVIIRADAELPYLQLQKLLFSLRVADISNTAYETKPGKDTDSAAAPAPAS